MGSKISSMSNTASSSDEDSEGGTGAKFLANSSDYTEDVVADRSSPMNNSASSSDDDNEGVIGAEFLAAVSENRGDDALRILQEAGISDLILVTDSTEDSALHIATRARDFDTVRQLIGFLQLQKMQNNNWRLLRLAVTQKDSQGNTALHLAFKNNDLHLARLLYMAGPQASWQENNDGEFLATKARALVSEEEFVELRVEYLRDPDRRISVPMTEISFSDIEIHIMRNKLLLRDEGLERRIIHLIRLAGFGAVDSVMQELSANPDLMRLGQRQEDTHMTMLHVAAKYGSVELLKKLVQFMISHEQSSLILKKDLEYGDTALHRAIRNNHKEAAIYLIGVAPEAAFHVNAEGATAFHLALRRGHGDLISQVFKFMPGSSVPKSLKESMLKNKDSLVHAVVGARNLVVLTKVLEELPEFVNVPNHKGWKPLSNAAYNGYLEEVRYILENYPHASKKFDADGSLPIHKAVGGGHTSIVSEFLSHSPQAIRDVDRRGRSILHFAVLYTKAHILSYLTKEIKQIEEIFGFKDHEGKTFADLAKELSNQH